MKLYVILLLFIPKIYSSIVQDEEYGYEDSDIEPVPNTPDVEPINHIFNGTYRVCGNETKKITCCKCEENVFDCSPYGELPLDMYRFSLHLNLPLLRNSNIKIANESFVVKTAIFNYNDIKKLVKDKLLPGNEHTVETLKLASNNIVEIENDLFDKFTSLKHLDLSHNVIKKIPGILTKQLGSTLLKLDLSHNSISIDSVDFSNLFKLEELYLSGNPINLKTKNATFIFPRSLSNLKILILKECSISGFGDDTFVNLINLETLDLKGNLLIAAVPKAFTSLINLRYSNLGGTLIYNLNASSFMNNTKLEYFHMTSSNLQRIGDCTFGNKPNLKSVMLYENRRLINS